MKSVMKPAFMILSVIPFSLLLCMSVAAQNAPAVDTESLDPMRTSNCEVASSAMDIIVQGTDVSKKIIILGYIGENETFKDIDLRRLHNAKTYIVELERGSRFSRLSETVITARATETRPEGQLEFYVDGNLKLSMRFLKHRALNLSPCFIEFGDPCKDNFKKLFYPCVGRK